MIKINTSGAVPHLNGDSDPVVCNCLQIHRSEIEAAIDDGAERIETLAQQTGATSVCGACRASLATILGHDQWTPVQLIDAEPVADDICTFRFAPRSGHFGDTLPGQHMIVRARIDGQWRQRPYTITSACHNHGYREITVKREEHGLFSNWLFDEADESALIFLSPPQGDFVATLNHAEPVICLVGGIGVTPALAFLRAWSHAPQPKFLYIDYSVSNQHQIAYADEFQQAAAQRPNADFRLRITNRDGYLSLEELRALVQRFPNGLFYICGPHGYQHAVKQHLRRLRIADDRIHIEIFRPTQQRHSVNKLYVPLGLMLTSLFLLQWLLQWQWPWLEAQQATESYKRWSGLALTVYMAAQFLLPLARARGRLRLAARLYRWHKWQGALAPAFYYWHSTHFGYAYLMVLGIVFFANTLVGLFNQEIIPEPRWKLQYQRLWLTVHIILSLLLVALGATHIFNVFTFQ